MLTVKVIMIQQYNFSIFWYFPTQVFFRDSLHVSELYKPLHDPLISCCVKILDMDKDNSSLGSRVTSAAKRIWSKVFPQPRRVWLPTGCLVYQMSLGIVNYSISIIMDLICALEHAAINGGFALGTANDVFNCFRLQLPSWCENIWGESSFGFNQGNIVISSIGQFSFKSYHPSLDSVLAHDYIL